MHIKLIINKVIYIYLLF